jgi:hypothetical protein
MHWALALAQLAAVLAQAVIDEWEHRRRVEQVHREAQAQCEFFIRLFKSLAEAIRDELGDDGLGPELRACLDAFDPIRIRELEATVDGLVANGKQSETVSELQTLTGLTWDEVFDVFTKWPDMTTDVRARWCTMCFMRTALASNEQRSILEPLKRLDSGV